MRARAVIGAGALALSACAGAGTVDPAAPGGWFWFKVASADERVAFYRAQCGDQPGCVETQLKRQALQSCLTEAMRDTRDEPPAERLEKQREDQRFCANRLLLPHGVQIR